MKVSTVMAIAVLNVMLFANPAFSHSFKVMLILPASITASSQARQIHQGFMLATTERDSHPDEQSDGHLGGLDVYVSVVNKIEAAIVDADIVIAFGSKKLPLHSGNKVAFLTKGQTPFLKTDLSAVKRFISAYKSRYGETPTSDAAQGYNAARRVDTAVRALGEADDAGLLNESFRRTVKKFNW